MEFQEVLALRHSCRSYEDTPVDRALLEKILDAARRAPSGCNLQQWTFIVVDEPEKRALLAPAVHDPENNVNSYAKDIPAFIVVVKTMEENVSEAKQKILGKDVVETVADIDIGCCIMQLCLAATDLGLGSVIMGKIDQESIHALLNIPQKHIVPVVIGLGYAKNKTVKPRPRKSLEEVIRWNIF